MFLHSRSFSFFLGSSRIISSTKGWKASFSSSIPVQQTLKDKVACVTGSTSGIGLGIAKSLAAQGCQVTLNGFGDVKEIESIQRSMESEFGTKTFYHSADMSKPQEIRSMVEETVKKFGKIDILVNNAGIQFVSNVDSFPDEKWEQIMAINLSAPFYAIKAALPFMKEQKWGRIVNISSVHGLVASVNKSAYVAAKHGVVGLSKTVALETAGTGITCNCINPGWVRTPLVEKQIEARAAEKNISKEEAVVDLLAEKQPSKQFVTVENLGQTVVFLCNDNASQLTGTCIVLDGGWTAQQSHSQLEERFAIAIHDLNKEFDFFVHFFF